MEIKENTLVAIISGKWSKTYHIALVTKEDHVQLRIGFGDAASSIIFCAKDDLVPVLETCTLELFYKILSTSGMPEIIKSFALRLSNLEADVFSLRRTK